MEIEPWVPELHKIEDGNRTQGRRSGGASFFSEKCSSAHICYFLARNFVALAGDALNHLCLSPLPEFCLIPDSRIGKMTIPASPKNISGILVVLLRVMKRIKYSIIQKINIPETGGLLP